MLQLPYQSEPLGGPPPPSIPPASTVRWRPLVPITLIGPTGIRRYFARALLDTGADDSVFCSASAALVGVSLRPVSGHGVRWRGQRYPMRFGDVQLKISDGNHTLQWRAVIAFSPAPIRYPILGLAGCLQFLDATFQGDGNLVEIRPNSLFPGTIAP